MPHRTLRLLCALAAILVSLHAAVAQELPTVGTPETLDVGTWNIEHFGNTGEGPSNEDLQLANARSVIESAALDVWGIQEADIQSSFNALVEALGAPYAGVWTADDTGFPIGYGFVYNTTVVQSLGVSRILESESEAFGFRPPLQMRARVLLPDTTLPDVRFIVLHAKAGGSFSDWQRRTDAANSLKNYVDNLVAIGIHVVVLGDLNDELRSSIAGGRTSPYQPFVQDSEDYLFTSYPLDLANVPTFCSNQACSNGSTLDHVLLAGPLLDDYVPGSTNRYDAVLDAFPNYVSTTSDHVPVYARLRFQPVVAAEGEAVAGAFGLAAPFPNPFRGVATLHFTLDRPGDARLEVFDALGRRVAVLVADALAAGPHTATFDAGALPPGLYLARLSADGRTSTRRLVHAQ